ncbi:hypothetical protein [Bdellovibrio bacteriovorus]|nr:hypothetical protein [Bdellovibrio bacteriovorus]
MITIDHGVWRKMDDANKAALVLHEAFYALVVPKASTSGGHTATPFRQESVFARKATSFIFSRDFEPTIKGWSWFKDLARDVDAFNIPDQLLSFKLMENAAGMGMAGDHFKITLVKEEYGYLSYSPMTAWGFNEANVRSFCQKVSAEAGAGTKHYITFQPLKIQISSQVPYVDPQTGKHRLGQYENKWAGLAVPSSIIVNSETCVKYLLGFKPGVPLAP